MFSDKQPWIGKPSFDLAFILLPPFLSLLIIFLFPSVFQDGSSMPELGWVILILLIDVAHVYSTLYRTYFDPAALQERRSLLWIVPIVGFVAGVMIYKMGSELFWRLLAYTAVFHFVRQQYGFMRVYSRNEQESPFLRNLDAFIIYYATLYPLLFWHLSGPRNFSWFVKDDFIFMKGGWVLSMATYLYMGTIVIFIIKETVLLIKSRRINLPKFLIITGTILSWYFGIVHFNGDLSFTLLNVVSHGIPYIALVWIYGKKKSVKGGTRFLKLVYSRFGIILFLLIIFALAFVEEGLWDITLWKEHGTVLGTDKFHSIELDKNLLNFLVPLLALPQITHYILDGFIWKVRKNDFKGTA